MSSRLVVLDGALGDVVLRLPALRAVAERWGPPRVWAPGRWCGPLGELGLAAEARRVDRASLLPLRGPAPERAREELEGVRHALLLSGDEGLVPGLEALGVSTERVEREPPPGVHQGVWAWRGASSWHEQGDIDDPRDLPLPLTSPPAGWSAPIGKSDVLLFPGSGGLGKCWPAERYAALALALALGARGVDVGVVLGPDELERGWSTQGYGRAQVFEAPGLRETAVLAARASLVVGNDAGTSHLAAAAGAKTLTLFGPTSPSRWRPMGPRARALVVEDLRALPVERVLEAVLA